MVKNIWWVNTPLEEIVRMFETQINKRQLEDPFLQEIKDVATAESDYQVVLKYLKDKATIQIMSKEPYGSPVHSYIAV